MKLSLEGPELAGVNSVWARGRGARCMNMSVKAGAEALSPQHPPNLSSGYELAPPPAGA